MKTAKFAKIISMSLVSVFLLTACPEQKKGDEASTDGGGGGGGGGPAPTCSSPSAGFHPADNGGFITGLTAGDSIKTVSFYFMESTSGKLGSTTMTLTAVSCDFNGATLEALSNQTVTTTMVQNYVKKTFTFSGGGITVPGCGTVAFLFTNVVSPGSSTTFYAGAQKTAGSSCQNTVASGNSGTPAAHGGAYSYTSEITQ